MARAERWIVTVHLSITSCLTGFPFTCMFWKSNTTNRFSEQHPGKAGPQKKNWQGVPPYITFNTKKTKSSSGQTIWQKSGTFSKNISPNFQISCKTSWKLYPLSDPSKVDPSARVQTLWPKILSRAWIANTRFFERSPFLRSLGLMMPSRTLSKGDYYYYVKNSFMFSFFLKKKRKTKKETKNLPDEKQDHFIVSRDGDERERRSPLPQIIRSSYPHLG